MFSAPRLAFWSALHGSDVARAMVQFEDAWVCALCAAVRDTVMSSIMMAQERGWGLRVRLASLAHNDGLLACLFDV